MAQALLAALWLVLGAANSAITVGQMDIFVAKASVLCREGSSQDCADLAWDFADRNKDDFLSPEELGALQQGMQEWFLAQEGTLPARTHNGIALGLIIARAVGVKRLLESYDKNADGLLSREEAFADIALDDRPLEAVVKDPEAFDRKAFVQRLGLAGPLLDGLE